MAGEVLAGRNEMITRIKALITAKRTPAPLTVAEAVSQYKAAQLSNDAQVRKAARDALDRAYGAAALAAGAVA